MGSAAGLLLCRCRKSTVTPLSFTSGPSCWDPHIICEWERGRLIFCRPSAASVCRLPHAMGYSRPAWALCVRGIFGPRGESTSSTSGNKGCWGSECWWMRMNERTNEWRVESRTDRRFTFTISTHAHTPVRAEIPLVHVRLHMPCAVLWRATGAWGDFYQWTSIYIYINETEWMKPLSCSSSLREIERKSRHMCGKSAFARASEGWDGNPHLLPVVVYFPRRVWRRQPLRLSHFSTRNGNWPQKREFVIFLSAVRMHCTYASTKAWRIAFCSPCSAQKQFYRQLKPKQINNFFRGGTLLL